MPLNSDEKGIVRLFHGFDDSVGSEAADGQTRCRAADGLMMGTVDFDAAGTRKGCQERVFGQDDMVGRNGRIKRLTVGNGKSPGGLRIDVLPDVPAKGQIDQLNAPTDGKDWLLLFVHAGKKKKLCPVAESGVAAAAG